MDAGPLVALIDRNDPDHVSCVECLQGLRSLIPLVTTWPVFTEAMLFAKKYLGRQGQKALWRVAETEIVEFADISSATWERMAHLMETYRDTPMDLADASLVALAENLGTDRIFTLDGDFEVYRLPRKKHFRLLP